MQKKAKQYVTRRASRIQRTKVGPMMKMILFSIMLFGLVEGGAQHTHLRLKADENEVPVGVVGAFRKQYVEAADASWTIISSSSLLEDFGISEEKKGEKATYYEVSFSVTDGNKEVVYDHFGHSVGVKKSVATSSLPSPIVKTVQDFSARAEIVSAEEVTQHDARPSHYLIVVSQAGELHSIIVHNSGEVIKAN